MGDEQAVREDERGLKIGVLWRKTGRDGREYLAGPFSRDLGIAVFFDEHKNTPNSPDAHVYLMKNREGRR